MANNNGGLADNRSRNFTCEENHFRMIYRLLGTLDRHKRQHEQRRRRAQRYEAVHGHNYELTNGQTTLTTTKHASVDLTLQVTHSISSWSSRHDLRHTIIQLPNIADLMPKFSFATFGQLYRRYNMDFELKLFCPDLARENPGNFLAFLAFLFMIIFLFYCGWTHDDFGDVRMAIEDDPGDDTSDGHKEIRIETVFTPTPIYKDEATQTEPDLRRELLQYLDGRFGKLDYKMQQLIDCCHDGHKMKRQHECGSQDAAIAKLERQMQQLLDCCSQDHKLKRQDGCEAEVDAARKQIAELEEELKRKDFKYHHDLMRYPERIQEAEERAKEAQKKQKELQKQVKDAQAKQNAVAIQLKEETERHVNAHPNAEKKLLQQQVDKLLIQATSAGNRIADLQNRLESTAMQKAEAEAKAASSIQALEQTRTKAAKKQAEAQKQDADHHTLVEKLSKTEKHAADLKKALGDAGDIKRAEIRAANKAKEEAIRALWAAEQGRDFAEDHHQMLANDESDWASERAEIVRQRDEALSANRNAEHQRISMQTERDGAMQRMRAAEEEAAAARAREQDLRSDLENLSKEARAEFCRLQELLSKSNDRNLELQTLEEQHRNNAAGLSSQLQAYHYAREQDEQQLQQNPTAVHSDPQISEQPGSQRGVEVEMDDAGPDTEDQRPGAPATQPQQSTIERSVPVATNPVAHQQPLFYYETADQSDQRMAEAGAHSAPLDTETSQHREMHSEGHVNAGNSDNRTPIQCAGCHEEPAGADHYGTNCPLCDTPGCTGRRIRGQCSFCCATHKVLLVDDTCDECMKVCEAFTHCGTCGANVQVDEENRCPSCAGCERCQTYKERGVCSRCCKKHDTALDDRDVCMLCAQERDAAVEDAVNDDDDDDDDSGDETLWEQVPGLECPRCNVNAAIRNGFCDLCQDCPVPGCESECISGVCQNTCGKHNEHCSVESGHWGECDKCRAEQEAQSSYGDPDDESDADDDEGQPPWPRHEPNSIQLQPPTTGVPHGHQPNYFNADSPGYTLNAGNGKPWTPKTPPREQKKLTVLEIEQRLRDRKAQGLCTRCGEKLVDGKCAERGCGRCKWCGESADDEGICRNEGCGIPTATERKNMGAEQKYSQAEQIGQDREEYLGRKRRRAVEALAENELEPERKKMQEEDEDDSGLVLTCPLCDKYDVTDKGACHECQKCPVAGCDERQQGGVCPNMCEKHEHINMSTGRCDECEAAKIPKSVPNYSKMTAGGFAPVPASSGRKWAPIMPTMPGGSGPISLRQMTNQDWTRPCSKCGVPMIGGNCWKPGCGACERCRGLLEDNGICENEGCGVPDSSTRERMRVEAIEREERHARRQMTAQMQRLRMEERVQEREEQQHEGFVFRAGQQMDFSRKPQQDERRKK